MLERDEASGQITLQIPVRLRLARREDLPKLEWAGQYAHFRNLYRRAFREQQQGRRLMLLADCNGHPIGQIFIQLSGHNPSMANGANRAYLYAFRVMDLFRGQGIGTWLIHEAEAVLAHEISHVSNGDMVTLALIQGVVNTFVIFFAKLFGYFVDRVLLKNERGPGIGAFAAEIVAQLVLGVLASMIVMWFSRQREFRADAGGASLAGRGKMIAALERLKINHEQATLPEKMAAFGISGGHGFSRLFMTHPPLDERIEALRSGR